MKRKKIEYKINENGCHICISHYKDKDGYPRAKRNGKQQHISRIIYERSNGPISEGLQIRHTCDTPSCINPEHLLIGTHADNARDREERGRSKKGIKHWRVELIDDQVIEIRKDIIHTQMQLAKKYMVSQGLISLIKNNKIWKHI